MACEFFHRRAMNKLRAKHREEREADREARLTQPAPSARLTPYSSTSFDEFEYARLKGTVKGMGQRVDRLQAAIKQQAQRDSGTA
jgi:hypothetical protein